MTITAKWIAFLHRTATGSRRARNLLTPVGATCYGLLVLLVVAAARHVDRWIGISDLWPGHLPIVLSLPLFTIAAIMIGWSVFHFLKAKGTPVPVNPPPRLVTTGPYAYSRNPMLTGVFALLFGIGRLLESISLLFFFAPLFILINVWELKVIEEPELLRRLGREYLEYRKKTPMFCRGTASGRTDDDRRASRCQATRSGIAFRPNSTGCALNKNAGLDQDEKTAGKTVSTIGDVGCGGGWGGGPHRFLVRRKRGQSPSPRK